jgi:uncharacterized membrane protein
MTLSSRSQSVRFLRNIGLNYWFSLLWIASERVLQPHSWSKLSDSLAISAAPIFVFILPGFSKDRIDIALAFGLLVLVILAISYVAARKAHMEPWPLGSVVLLWSSISSAMLVTLAIFVWFRSGDREGFWQLLYWSMPTGIIAIALYAKLRSKARKRLG